MDTLIIQTHICYRAVPTVITFRSTSNLASSYGRTNCQLSTLHVNSIVSSDLAFKPDWNIYEKLNSNACRESDLWSSRNNVRVDNDTDGLQGM